MYSQILIRYGELSTKGKNKMTFVRQLEKNIDRLVGIKPSYSFDRMYIPYSEENIQALQRVFGIHSYSPVVTCETNEQTIIETILKLIESTDAKTFKCEITRSWKGYPGTSTELNGVFGSKIYQATQIAVDVKKPELKIEVEIREKESHIFIKRIKGLGGYPTGINGRVIHLISGGIDSPVAAYLMMKRGIHVDFVNFVTPPHTDERTVEKVDKIVQFLTQFQGQSTLYRNNYTDLMNYIGLVSDQGYKINLMRRSFYRIVSRLAEDNHYLGISNGENVGQVASQTLESMATIESQATLPVYRPLLTMDKLETIAIGEKIGTFQLSLAQCLESCELFAPKEPVTKPSKLKAEKLEKELSHIFDMEDANYKNNWERKSFSFDARPAKESEK